MCGREGLWRGSKDLMQEINKVVYVMIEVFSDGCIHEPDLDITLNRQDMRSKFEYLTLCNIVLF